MDEGLCLSRACERVLHHRMPGHLRLATLAVIAAHDEAIFGAGHADIEQASIFLLSLGARLDCEGLRKAVARIGSGTPQIAFPLPPKVRWVEPKQARQMAVRKGRRATVDKEHNRCLQPLGGMRRHDADFTARLIHLALDLGPAAFQQR